MNEQLYFLSPFGLERVHAEHRYHEGWGWAWAVTLWDGARWHTIDSGYSKSDRKALRAISWCLEVLADYEDLDQLLDDEF